MLTAYYSDTGGRSCNEDTVLLKTVGDAVCAVVADGLGGHGGGAIASRTAAEVFYQNWNGEGDTETLLKLGHTAHIAVQGEQTPTCAMKSTLVALVVKDREAAWVHAGDSRLYRFHNGKLEFQTRDHSASQLAVLLGEITPEQIRFHADRSKIMRALGQAGDVKIDAASAELETGEYAFLLCSDGFWEYVMESEMEEELSASQNPEEWINRMRKRLGERVPADNDNNTAAAVWLELK